MADPDDVGLLERLKYLAPLGPTVREARRLRDAMLLLERDGMAVNLPYHESRVALPVDIIGMPSNVPAGINGLRVTSS